MLTGYVLGNMPALVIPMMRALGFSNQEIGVVLNDLYNAVTGVFGFAITPPLAALIWLYQQISNINVSIPNWVTWLYDFVVNHVAPLWSWLLNEVQDLVNVVKNIDAQIIQTAQAIISDVLAAYEDALNFADWLYANFGHVLASFLSNPVRFLAPLIGPLVLALFPELAPLIVFFTNVIIPAAQFLAQFLANPIGFIGGIFNLLIATITAPFRPLLDFLTWWQAKGAPFLLALIDDPVKVILDLIAPAFLDWLLKLIAANW